MAAEVPLPDRFAGSLLGLALGDARGAPHEGGAVGGLVRKLAEVEPRETLRWTDDTEMALGTAASLLACGGLDPDHLAATWAARYDWARGYGAGARKLLELIARGEDWRTANRLVFPEGSFGNGAAMRAAPLGLWFHRDDDALRAAARAASGITHAHPLGIEGGLVIARATALALRTPAAAGRDWGSLLDALHDDCREVEFRSRLVRARELLRNEPARPQVIEALGNGIRAQESAVTAVYVFCRFADREFDEMIDYLIQLGGDVDTLGAMAGGIFGAHRGSGALPGAQLARLERCEEIEGVARRMAAAAP